MKEEYKIKGIEKILEKFTKKQLAEFFGVDENEEFEKIITYSLREKGIPNNSEVAIYVVLTSEEARSVRDTDIAKEFYENDDRQRALYGINYNLAEKIFAKGDVEQEVWHNSLYFAIDEPIKEADLDEVFVCSRVGGVNYNGLIMGGKFYEEHKEELDKSLPNEDKREAVESYIENFVNEFNDVEFTGPCYGPRPRYEETDEIRVEKEKNEKIILELTGKRSIDELSLRDFINLKRRLEQEEKDLQKAFEEKITQRED